MNQEQINKKWSRSSEMYNEIIHDELDSFRPAAWIKQILENAPQKDCLNILDTGCGPGFFSIILSQKGHRVIGIDGAKGMLAKAKQNADAYGVAPVFLDMDCHSLLFVDNSFDLIVSRNVTHALHRHETVYKEWLRVLRPGGVLLIFDANWQLDRVDKKLAAENKRRREECLRIYGSTFGDQKSLPEEYEKEPHVLGGNIRPDWDVALLERVGYRNIAFDRNIIEELWDDKEKLIYGATPMFMIRAVK
ncbi:MAG: class I SAM-dependent methyltransferase [Candidatus ainarchaeum sp.]|jgi:SAM-dependent methyltransferase|nr:class I SAM-dependent methyltransferase [Candidatus ainarchaeum sp.]MDD4428740.1 class I SAM-dependent methyltransferase [Paludibacter sp.]